MTEYEKLIKTANQCGIKIISDDFCMKLLAWLMHCGDTEAVTYNVKLRTDIAEAQRRLNCYGGEIPDRKLAEKFRQYGFEISEKKAPVWINEIKERYGL